MGLMTKAKTDPAQTRNVSRIALVSICKTGTGFRPDDIGTLAVCDQGEG
jgi:hypothetical protein